MFVSFRANYDKFRTTSLISDKIYRQTFFQFAVNKSGVDLEVISKCNILLKYDECNALHTQNMNRVIGDLNSVESKSSSYSSRDFNFITNKFTGLPNFGFYKKINMAVGMLQHLPLGVELSWKSDKNKIKNVNI